MMKVLIIEDDPIKLNGIKSFMTKFNSNIQMDTKMSYQSGLLILLKENYDLVLLDMQLPNYDIKSGEDGYKPRPVAGRDIMRELKRKKVQTHVIIVTQYEGFGENGKFESLEEWDRKLAKEFDAFYVTMIEYRPGSNAWQDKLTKHLNILISDKSSDS
ncbi:MAG: response regulator [Filimonas sp.]|nr:response regulator [Filimonas sp.]